MNRIQSGMGGALSSMIDAQLRIERRFGRSTVALVLFAVGLLTAIVGLTAIVLAGHEQPAPRNLEESPRAMYCGAVPAACKPSVPPAVVAWSDHDKDLVHYFKVIYETLPAPPPRQTAGCALATLVHATPCLQTVLLVSSETNTEQQKALDSPPRGASPAKANLSTPAPATKPSAPSPNPSPSPTLGPDDAGFARLAAVPDPSESPSAALVASQRIATHDLNTTVDAALVRLNGLATDQYARTLQELGPSRRHEMSALHEPLLCYRRRLHDLAVLQNAWYQGRLRSRDQWVVESCAKEKT